MYGVLSIHNFCKNDLNFLYKIIYGNIDLASNSGPFFLCFDLLPQGIGYTKAMNLKTMIFVTQIEIWSPYVINPLVIEYLMIITFTDYGRPMKPFSLKFRTFRLGQTDWADKFWGIWVIFGQTISTHLGTVSSLSMFSIIQPSFIQKLSQISYLGLGFEFGPQRIRDLAFMCP